VRLLAAARGAARRGLGPVGPARHPPRRALRRAASVSVYTVERVSMRERRELGGLEVALVLRRTAVQTDLACEPRRP
jgi:hypothetical protein